MLALENANVLLGMKDGGAKMVTFAINSLRNYFNEMTFLYI